MLFPKKLNNQKGLSLIETIIALTVLTMGVVYLVSLFPYGLSSAKISEQQTVGVNLAQAKMEELISKAYEEVAAGQVSETSLGSIDPDFSSYSRQTSVALVDGDLNSSLVDLGLKKIGVTVFWLDALSRATSSISLNGLITSY